MPNNFRLLLMMQVLAMALFGCIYSAKSAEKKINGTKVRTNGLERVTDINWWQQKEKNASVHVVVNKLLQQAKIYANGKFVSMSNVSTGKMGHETPGGIFSILGKRRYHHSNIYSRAPMPFMQRLTWSGIALHESKSVPPYPASHGCVRLPGGFADSLFQFTSIGAQVIITEREVRPEIFHSKKMFQITKPDPISFAQLRPTNDTGAAGVATPVSLNSTGQVKKISPLRVLLTRRSGREKTMEIQSILTELKYLDDEIDGWMGPQTGAAITRFQKDYRHKPTGSLTPELLGQLYRATGRGKPKYGHLYVRRDQKPVFDEAVAITDPEISLGTHHYMAIPEAKNDSVGGKNPHWVSISIEDTWWKMPKTKNKTEAVIGTLETASSSAKTALERFDISPELHKKVSDMMVAGSTVIVSDQGLSKETGKGTDFIVLTQDM